jgi:AcrR family transcriptional regulator
MTLGLPPGPLSSSVEAPAFPFFNRGSFFHHFKSKDDLARAAAAYFGETTEGFFASAPYHNLKNPLDRLFGYVDFRAEHLRGDLPDYTCLLGTLVQETYATHPDIGRLRRVVFPFRRTLDCWWSVSCARVVAELRRSDYVRHIGSVSVLEAM